MRSLWVEKMARPTKYRQHFADIAKGMCLMGATLPELATALEVAPSTVSKWLDEKDEFSEAVKQGKANSDTEVVKSLFNRAKGCSVPDSDIRVIDGEIVITPLVKHFPPDTTACIFWLQNRMRDQFKPRKAEDDSELAASVADSLAKIASRLPD